jgi:hypothetical protein
VAALTAVTAAARSPPPKRVDLVFNKLCCYCCFCAGSLCPSFPVSLPYPQKKATNSTNKSLGKFWLSCGQFPACRLKKMFLSLSPSLFCSSQSIRKLAFTIHSFNSRSSGKERRLVGTKKQFFFNKLCCCCFCAGSSCPSFPVSPPVSTESDKYQRA